jgi:hypothetical protein
MRTFCAAGLKGGTLALFKHADSAARQARPTNHLHRLRALISCHATTRRRCARHVRCSDIHQLFAALTSTNSRPGARRAWVNSRRDTRSSQRRNPDLKSTFRQQTPTHSARLLNSAMIPLVSAIPMPLIAARATRNSRDLTLPEFPGTWRWARRSKPKTDAVSVREH